MNKLYKSFYGNLERESPRMLICNFKNIKYQRTASGWLESHLPKFKSISQTLSQKREVKERSRDIHIQE